jgi:hypothetical protein
LDVISTIASFGTPDAALVALAHQHDPPVKVVVGADFDKTQLANATARTAWIESMVARVKSLGIDGLNLDIEGNSAHRDELSALVAELRSALTAADPAYQLSFDLGISPKGQSGGYDHKALSAAMNFTVPMAYDECWGASTASANSPLGRLTQGMDDYASLGVGANKLVMGLPWYGWDFPCTESSGDVCSVKPPAGKPWYGYATQVVSETRADPREHALMRRTRPHDLRRTRPTHTPNDAQDHARPERRSLARAARDTTMCSPSRGARRCGPRRRCWTRPR